MDTLNSIIDGKKTYLGLLLIALGYFGYSSVISANQLGQGFDLLTQLVGLIISVYGNYQSHKTIGSLKAQVGALTNRV